MDTLADSEQEVKRARDAVAARITPQRSVSLEGSDVIRVAREERLVRLYFRKRIDVIRVIITSMEAQKEVGPLVEVELDSPGCERGMTVALSGVGAKLRKA